MLLLLQAEGIHYSLQTPETPLHYQPDTNITGVTLMYYSSVVWLIEWNSNGLPLNLSNNDAFCLLSATATGFFFLNARSFRTDVKLLDVMMTIKGGARAECSRRVQAWPQLFVYHVLLLHKVNTVVTCALHHEPQRRWIFSYGTLKLDLK